VLQCQAAEDTAAALTAALPELNVGLVHGRMPARLKERAMKHFQAGELQLLVATTVIEVGVDVPNASLMIIENAERLGLAQLHQLRGRVGRGAVESSCVLLYHRRYRRQRVRASQCCATPTTASKSRAATWTFAAPAKCSGTRQAGELRLRIADLTRDAPLIPRVQQAASMLLERDSERAAALVERWLGDNSRYGEV